MDGFARDARAGLAQICRLSLLGRTSMLDKHRNNLRGAGRLAVLLAVIAKSALVYVLLPRHRRNAGAKALWLQATCRRALSALAVRVESCGEPAHGAVIAANHLSYMDILVLAS